MYYYCVMFYSGTEAIEKQLCLTLINCIILIKQKLSEYHYKYLKDIDLLP